MRARPVCHSAGRFKALLSTLYAIAALWVFQGIGDALVRWLGLPLPGPVAGMLLLFAALALHGRVPAPLIQTTGPLLRHLMLLFIPSIAGVAVHFRRLADEWVPFLAASALGAAVTLAVTALTLQWMLQRTGKVYR